MAYYKVDERAEQEKTSREIYTFFGIFVGSLVVITAASSWFASL